jgi:hypothetical protein
MVEIPQKYRKKTELNSLFLQKKHDEVKKPL